MFPQFRQRLIHAVIERDDAGVMFLDQRVDHFFPSGVLERFLGNDHRVIGGGDGCRKGGCADEGEAGMDQLHSVGEGAMRRRKVQ